MVHHVSLGSEAFAAALRTGKGSLVQVDSHMNLQILFLAEGLPAARKLALERLCSKVNVQVGIKAKLS